MEDKDPRLIIQGKRNVHPYGSVFYPMAVIFALFLCLNLIFPAVLHIEWAGSLFEVWILGILYFIAYVICTMVFLAVAGYFAIMIEVARNLKKLKHEDIGNENVARALAVRVLTGNQPRWLISLTPCAVPAMSLALVSLIYHAQLRIDGWVTLLQMCVLLSLTTFILCLPFILKSQTSFEKDIKAIEDEKKN